MTCRSPGRRRRPAAQESTAADLKALNDGGLLPDPLSRSCRHADLRGSLLGGLQQWRSWVLSATRVPRWLSRSFVLAALRALHLDSRASLPDLHHDTQGDPVSQYAGGGRGLPRAPSSLPDTKQKTTATSRMAQL